MKGGPVFSLKNQNMDAPSFSEQLSAFRGMAEMQHTSLFLAGHCSCWLVWRGGSFLGEFTT